MRKGGKKTQWRYEPSKEKGSISDMEEVLTTLPTSPIKISVIGSCWLTSYSNKVCLQAPQGPTGLSTILCGEFAVIAILLTFLSGKVAPAFHIATRSAHIPDGYAAFS